MGIFRLAGALGQIAAQSGDRERARKLLELAIGVGKKGGIPGTADLERVLKGL